MISFRNALGIRGARSGERLYNPETGAKTLGERNAIPHFAEDDDTLAPNLNFGLDRDVPLRLHGEAMRGDVDHRDLDGFEDQGVKRLK